MKTSLTLAVVCKSSGGTDTLEAGDVVLDEGRGAARGRWAALSLETS